MHMSKMAAASSEERRNRREGREEMGQNVMGDVITGCRDTPGGDVAARWWEKR